MQDIKNFTLEELKNSFKLKSYPQFCAKQVFDWLYKKRVEKIELMTNLSKDLRKSLEDEICFSKLKLLKTEISTDSTKKFLFELKDSSLIETVLIPEKTRNTLCISTQVGCKYKCSFCVSGGSGFKRNLEVSEIINQYLFVLDSEKKHEITNIVFMGIGEPLDNFTNVVKAINILTDSAAVSFSKRKIIVSTCGLTPEIKRLADLKLGIKLSLSLHSADNKIRSRLMPVNKKYPLKGLMTVIRKFSRKTKYPVTFEYVLIRGVNISAEDVRKLANLLIGINAKINLIPYNGKSKEFSSPGNEEITRFKSGLRKRNLFFTLREPRGQDINAACGQLRAEFTLLQRGLKKHNETA